VDPLEAFCHHGFNAEKHGAFCSPVTAGARAVLFPREYNQRGSPLFVFHAGIIDWHLGAFRLELRHPTFCAWDHLVFDADIGKGAAHHHLVVPAARAVGVEVLHTHLVTGEVGPCWAVHLDRTGR